MMARVNLADDTHALHCRLVADMAAERITRVRGVNDDATAAQNFRRLPDKTRLRIIGMDGEQLSQGKRSMAGSFT
jgi:hypothetical protein